MQSFAPNLSNFPRKTLIAAALAVAGVVAVIVLLTGGGTQAPPSGAPAVTVAQPLKQQVTDWYEYTGQFAPVEYVELRARVSGYVTEIHFTDGQMVKKGDLLFVIDPRPYENALASARARADQAGASREFASRQLNRAGELRQRDFVAQSTLDQRTQESRGAGAGAEAARASVRDAELNLEFTRVVAPISGRVSARQVSIGNLINGGGTATLLTTIVSLDPIWFNFDMSEADYLALQRSPFGRAAAGRIDVPADIRLEDESGWPRHARLDFLDNQMDRGTGTIRARAVLDNADQFITPGTFGRVRLAASAPYDGLLVPDSAIVTDQSRKLVMTVGPDGTVVPKPVRLGSLVGGLRVVADGIGADDKVIINGLMRARPGTKVAPEAGTIAADPAVQK